MYTTVRARFNRFPVNLSVSNLNRSSETNRSQFVGRVAKRKVNFSWAPRAIFCCQDTPGRHLADVRHPLASLRPTVRPSARLPTAPPAVPIASSILYEGFSTVLKAIFRPYPKYRVARNEPHWFRIFRLVFNGEKNRR